LIKYKYQILLLLSFTIFISCQEGLKPEAYEEIPTTSALAGVVEFLGGKEKFPDSSKVFGVHVAAFKKFPKDSSGILPEILKGNVYVNLTSYSYPADSIEFSIDIKDAPVNLEYIVVSMQTVKDTVNSQRVIGVYTLSGDNTQPSQLMIDRAKKYFIRIKVDWDNLPPQPF